VSSAGPTPVGNITVGVVGYGRAGRALALALSAAGHPVRMVAARSAAARAAAAADLPAASVRDLPGPLALPNPAALADLGEVPDVIFITVPDDAIGPVAASLATVGLPLEGVVVAHAGGRHGVEVLAPVLPAGAARLAMHPIMTMPAPGAAAAPISMDGVTFGVTADPAAAGLAARLVADLGGRTAWIAEADRALYHSAFALGANYVATLVAVAVEQLAAVGLPDPGQALRPLLAATVENTLRWGPAAMTGPVARGEEGTVAAHLNALAARDPALADAYAALAELTLDRLDAPAAPPAGLPSGPDTRSEADGPSGPSGSDAPARRARLRQALRDWRSAVLATRLAAPARGRR